MSLSVVVAPDSFKGTISAADASRAIRVGWLSVRPGDQVSVIPQADGGEGTCEAIAVSVATTCKHDTAQVEGPDGRPTSGFWIEFPDNSGVIELASVSGIPLMATLDPLGAHTRGLGQVARAVIESGVTSLIIGLGGSASTDGATGALTALGYTFLDARGTELPPGGGHLSRLHSIDSSRAMSPPPGGVTLLTDVTAPLLGVDGAAKIFGPQKGATAADVLKLEAGLERFAEVVASTGEGPSFNPATPGAGAAGGTAFGLTALWGKGQTSVHLEPGAAWIARHTGLENSLANADILITGEGSFDEQSLLGKTTGHVLGIAERLGVRRWVIAGSVASSPSFPPKRCDVIALSTLAGSVDAAKNSPAYWIEKAAACAAQSTV
ncbi:MAG: glycerate kinase [Microbacteriaceae bacterium]